METEHGMDRNAALADMRYNFIENVCEKSVVRCKESKEHIRSVKIDNQNVNENIENNQEDKDNKINNDENIGMDIEN